MKPFNESESSCLSVILSRQIKPAHVSCWVSWFPSMHSTRKSDTGRPVSAALACLLYLLPASLFTSSLPNDGEAAGVQEDKTRFNRLTAFKASCEAASHIESAGSVWCSSCSIALRLQKRAPAAASPTKQNESQQPYRAYCVSFYLAFNSAIQNPI